MLFSGLVVVELFLMRRTIQPNGFPDNENRHTNYKSLFREYNRWANRDLSKGQKTWSESLPEDLSWRERESLPCCYDSTGKCGHGI